MSTETKTASKEGFLEEGAAFTEIAKHITAGDSVPDSYDVVVIGGGQAGLSVGYFLKQTGLRFVILDGSERIGDSWRARWDSLRLFTPARYDSLPGMAFPAPGGYFPTKDEMADYLESYARRFELPVVSGVRVSKLRRDGDRYLLRAGDRVLEAAQVVVAMANYQRPKVPEMAAELAPEINQLHSFEYRNPGQLRDGGVLIVGAGNSGAEIARELSRDHHVWLSGRHTGNLPFAIDGLFGRFWVLLTLRLLFHRLITIKTRLGRKLYPEVTNHGGPLIRVKPKHLAAAGVEWVPRTAGVTDGKPRLEDGRVLDVANVVWCTGFHPAFSWIELPIFEDNGKPRHQGGIVDEAPGLYFVGLHFLYALTSAMIHGVGRDAERIVAALAERAEARAPARQRLAA